MIADIVGLGKTWEVAGYLLAVSKRYQSPTIPIINNAHTNGLMAIDSLYVTVHILRATAWNLNSFTFVPPHGLPTTSHHYLPPPTTTGCLTTTYCLP